MSITTLAGINAIWVGFVLEAEVEVCIFTNSLMGTTIQDSGMKERSVFVLFDSFFFFLQKAQRQTIVAML